MNYEDQPTIIHEWTAGGSRLGVDAKGGVWIWYNMDWTEGPDAEPSYWAPLSEVYPAKDVGLEIVRLAVADHRTHRRHRGGGGVSLPEQRFADVSAECERLREINAQMLEACKAALAWYGPDGDHISDPARSLLVKAIAKAEAA